MWRFAKAGCDQITAPSSRRAAGARRRFDDLSMATLPITGRIERSENELAGSFSMSARF